MSQRLRSFVRSMVRITAVAVVLLLVAAGGLYLRLLSGPIDTPIPQPMLDRIVAEAAPGWRVEAGGARLDFSSDDGLNGLQLHDVSVFDPEGQRIVAVPRVGLQFVLAASLDPYKALRVREVALNGAQVDVIRNPDGEFQFDIGSEADSGGENDPFAGVLQEESLDMLPRLRVEDARVTYRDLRRGTTWRTKHARLTLDPSSKGLAAELALTLAGGSGGAVLNAVRFSETGNVRTMLRLDRVTPSRIAGIHPWLEELARVDAPLTGNISSEIHSDGTVQKIDTDLVAEAGSIQLMGDQPTELQAFAARFSCDAFSHACNVSELSIRTPNLTGRASGGLMRTSESAYTGEFVLGESTVRPSPESAPVSASGGLLSLGFNSETGSLEVENLALNGVALPDGLSVELAELSGKLDTSSQDVIVEQWRVEGVTAPIKDDQTLSVEEARGGKARFANEILTLRHFEASALHFNNNRITRHSVQKMTGKASYHIANEWLDLETTASGVTVTDPSLPTPLNVTGLSAAGRVDFAAQTFSDARIIVSEAALPLAELYVLPVHISHADVTASGQMSDAGYSLQIHDATTIVDGLPAYLNGTVTLRENGSYSGALAASVDPTDIAGVKHHWPRTVAPGGLEWVRENLLQGQVDALNIAATLDTESPENDTLDLNFDFRDAAMSYVPGMPPIVGARGRGRVTLDRLDVVLSDGQVVVPHAGALMLGGSSFSIADLSPDIPTGEVRLKARGEVQSVLRLLDTEPLSVISPTDLDIASTEGQATVNGSMTLPLDENVAMDDIRFDARAKVHEYFLFEPQTGAEIAGDVMLVHAKPDGMTLQSDARIDGLSARLGFRQEFNRQPAGTPEGILTIESFVSPEDFARHGVDLRDYMSGLSAMTARVSLFEGGLAQFDADIDLTNIHLHVDEIGWAKPAGVPAIAHLAGMQDPNGGGKVESVSLRGQGMVAEGGLTFDSEGRVNFAQFSRVALGRSADVGFRYAVKPEGGASIRVEGPWFDLRKAFADAIEGQGGVSPATNPNIGAATEISLNVGRIILRDDLTIFNTRGAIRLRDEGFNAAELEGHLNGQAPAKLRAERRNDGIALRLTSTDGGGFLQAADVFDAARGGRLMLDARTTNTVSPSRIRGVIRFDNVTVHDSPTMRDIFSGGAISSLVRDMAADGIQFEKLEMPFTGVGSTWNIENGVAFGPSLGLTLDGSYDLAVRRLDLDGSVSPAYAINGALGKIPLLGQVLAGGEGEGVFGVTFSVEGDSANPTVRVNPLSAIAPGFLRRIVAEVGKGGDGAPSQQRSSFRFNDR